MTSGIKWNTEHELLLLGEWWDLLPPWWLWKNPSCRTYHHKVSTTVKIYNVNDFCEEKEIQGVEVNIKNRKNRDGHMKPCIKKQYHDLLRIYIQYNPFSPLNWFFFFCCSSKHPKDPWWPEQWLAVKGSWGFLYCDPSKQCCKSCTYFLYLLILLCVATIRSLIILSHKSASCMYHMFTLTLLANQMR